MNVKQLVAAHAVREVVKSGYRVGLGSGSTAIHCVAALSKLIAGGTIRDILVAASSFETLEACYQHELPVRELIDSCFTLPFDVYIDGADEVCEKGALIKGGGGAHLMEKIIASHSAQFVVIADDSKLVELLGTKAPVPVEVIPQARRVVAQRLQALGGDSELRKAQKKLGPVVTEQGNFILDAKFPAIKDPRDLDRKIHDIPGVVEHGIFVTPFLQFIVSQDGRIARKLVS